MLFTPFYLPLVGIAMLLMFTFLSGLPTKYKLPPSTCSPSLFPLCSFFSTA